MTQIRRTAAAATVALLLSQAQAVAVTQPVSGAVEKPSDLCLRLPFADGETAIVWSTYGGAMHVGTNRPKYANDYYALDMTLAGRPEQGKGQQVVAVASGTVRLAGWGTDGWASYGQRVVLEHDFRDADGGRYFSLYAHLNSVAVSEGASVEAGEAVGTLGESSFSSLVGAGVHLHFALYRNCTVGGSGTGGCFGGNAVVPEPIAGEGNLRRESRIEALQGTCYSDRDDIESPGGDEDDELGDEDPNGPGGFGSGPDAGLDDNVPSRLVGGACAAAGVGDSAALALLFLIWLAVTRRPQQIRNVHPRVGARRSSDRH